VSEMTVIAWVL